MSAFSLNFIHFASGRISDDVLFSFGIFFRKILSTNFNFSILDASILFAYRKLKSDKAVVRTVESDLERVRTPVTSSSEISSSCVCMFDKISLTSSATSLTLPF